MYKKNPNSILLEGGNWAEYKNPAYNKDKSDFIFSIMQRLKYDAACLGHRELAFGARHYEQLSNGSPVILVSNVEALVGGKKTGVGQPYLIREIGGVKVGVFGLVGEEQGTKRRSRRHKKEVKTDSNRDYIILDSVQTGRRMVTKMREAGCEVVVLLTQLAPSDVNKVIRTVDGIDVAILGYKSDLRKTPRKTGETIVVRTGFRGQFLGFLELEVDPAGKIVNFSGLSMPVHDKLVKDSSIRKLVIDYKKTISHLQKEEEGTGRVRSKMH